MSELQSGNLSDWDPALFDKQDRAPDPEFYALPRKVVHIDDGAIAALTQLYRELLPPQGVLLDLMSSWRSHLPAAANNRRVVGLGMNADEMRDNPQLAEYVVKDLNAEPVLPYADCEFDAACCAVSVQYLQHPVEVFREVRRCLKPASPFVVSFSNRCFPTKAIHLWHETDDAGHMELVKLYFASAGGWSRLSTRDCSPASARRSRSDPLYAVWAYAS
jgi:SAM-dependent methyltransferase